ncbi:MAG: hypothetical protein JSW26_16680 [Desulfobacterales bacterium]|nr:MAG: hypothetical protein JSW26_16680 [Desulfobacterales bacterium]
MAKEHEILLDDSDTSEESSEEQTDRVDTIRQVLDARDFIAPLKEIQDESLDPDEPPKSGGSEESTTQEIELSLDGVDFQMDNDQTDTEKEIALKKDAAETDEEPEENDPTDDMPVEDDNPVEDDTGIDAPDNDNADDEEEAAAGDDLETMTAEPQTGTDQEVQDTETLPDGDIPDIDLPPAEKLQTRVSEENIQNDFVGLDDDDELEVKFSKSKAAKPKAPPSNQPDGMKPGKAAAKKIETESPPVESKHKPPSKKPAENSGTLNTAHRQSMISKMISFALIGLIAAGFIFYNNPALIGLKKSSEPTPPPVVDPVQPAQPAATQTDNFPSLPSRQDSVMAKLEEANDLRNQLLEKKEEIYKLNLYYRNGIAELEENIYQEAQKEGIKTFEQALTNKRIELNLRTIQRRLAYITELEKPAYWVDSGSEKLLFLIRKAQLDLELIDIADGIDMNRHKRHIEAAINQYRPSSDRLVIDLQEDKLTSLEKIWQQASNKKNTNEKISLNTKDEEITAEICSGNFGRIAELTEISPDTARCLSRMKGSDLFLNGVTQLLPDAARELFQWQGNWLCLNGMRELSPAVAKHLFTWKGNWISLNGLAEFQPELALYLLKWEGEQLELMGLKYHKKDAEQKTLKYLALWETTGGRLFVSDEIRKEMGRIMLSQVQ